MARGEERKPRPGRGTEVGDAIYSLSRSYSDFCGLLQAGVLPAEEIEAEKAGVMRRLKVLVALMEKM